MTDNSNYEQRVASENHNYEIASTWQECLQKNAGVSEEFEQILKKQAEAKNMWKPIGAYFGNVDWIEKVDPNYSQRLENRDVTMAGSLVESIHTWFRKAPKTWDGIRYSAEPVDVTIEVAIKVLRAAEIDVPRKYNSAESLVREHIKQHESELRKEIRRARAGYQ